MGLTTKAQRDRTKAHEPQKDSVLPMSQTPSQSILYDMNSPAITIRPGYADDDLAISQLAALDSAETVPSRPLLLAEVDGQLRVALSLRDGSSIADPFFPTAAILTMLRGHVRASRRKRRRSKPLRLSRGAARLGRSIAPGRRTGRRTPAWSR